jgi:hypothetical protein
MGLGGVGLCAVMAAKMSGCHTIVGVDRISSRLGRFSQIHFFSIQTVSGATEVSLPKHTAGPNRSNILKRFRYGSGLNGPASCSHIFPET